MAWQTNQGNRSQDTRASQHPCGMQDVGASGAKQWALRAKQDSRVGCHRGRTKLQWMIGGISCTINTVYQKIVPPVPRFRRNLESRGAVSLPQGDHRYCMRYRGLLEHLHTEHNPVCWALAGMHVLCCCVSAVARRRPVIVDMLPRCLLRTSGGHVLRSAASSAALRVPHKEPIIHRGGEGRAFFQLSRIAWIGGAHHAECCR
ncbi:hypothetical protein OH76DRAFT_1403287 [Lentinus brumalis]|uniref:Uncharacterized protein n=1 Tax=Lentinus brumalis TaxID=2498619 RepID=A0A371DAZ7_9APHY|nr:hypothetical protein OH76DRAFT_1403287 [Polyporus brumalis]